MNLNDRIAALRTKTEQIDAAAKARRAEQCRRYYAAQDAAMAFADELRGLDGIPVKVAYEWHNDEDGTRGTSEAAGRTEAYCDDRRDGYAAGLRLAHQPRTIVAEVVFVPGPAPALCREVGGELVPITEDEALLAIVAAVEAAFDHEVDA